MNWLKQPYFTPGPQIVVLTTIPGFPTWFTTPVVSLDSYLQSVLASTLSGVDYWLTPGYYNPLATNKTEAGVIAAYVATAVDRVQRCPQSSAGLDPTAVGTEYGTLLVNILKAIDSGQFTGGAEGKSVWDAWVGDGGRMKRALLAIALLTLTGCAASNPATASTPAAPANPLLTVSTALAKIQQTNQQFATTVIAADSAKLMSDSTARSLLSISLKISQAGDQAAAVIQGLNSLPAGTKITVWNVLAPVSSAVQQSLATGLLPISDVNTKTAVQSLLTTIQATLAVVQVTTGN